MMKIREMMHRKMCNYLQGRIEGVLSSPELDKRGQNLAPEQMIIQLISSILRIKTHFSDCRRWVGGDGGGEVTHFFLGFRESIRSPLIFYPVFLSLRRYAQQPLPRHF